MNLEAVYLSRTLRTFYPNGLGGPLAMQAREAQEAMAKVQEFMADEMSKDFQDLQARVEQQQTRGLTRHGTETRTVTVIPVRGFLTQRLDLLTFILGGTSLSWVQLQMSRALRNRDVQAIVLDVDSGGGSVYGVPELAAAVRRARKVKTVIASVNGTAASAAYWIAASAGKLVAAPSAEVGSIGVIAAHVDQSKFDAQAGVKVTYIAQPPRKVEGNRHQPLDPDAQAYIQQQVDTYHQMFVAGVARGRSVPASDVNHLFGEGRTLLAGDALKVRMIDQVGTLEDVLQELGAIP
jgi:capsid assembly protease